MWGTGQRASVSLTTDGQREEERDGETAQVLHVVNATHSFDEESGKLLSKPLNLA